MPFLTSKTFYGDVYIKNLGPLKYFPEMEEPDQRLYFLESMKILTGYSKIVGYLSVSGVDFLMEAS